MKVGIGLLFIMSLIVAGMATLTPGQRMAAAEAMSVPPDIAYEAGRQLDVFIDWAAPNPPIGEEERGQDI